MTANENVEGFLETFAAMERRDPEGCSSSAIRVSNSLAARAPVWRCLPWPRRRPADLERDVGPAPTDGSRVDPRVMAATEVPTHVIAARDDRFFPIDFQRRIAQERLHVAVDELAGGHLVAFESAGSRESTPALRRSRHSIVIRLMRDKSPADVGPHHATPAARRGRHGGIVDEDLEAMTREQLIAETRRLRAGIRAHRNSTGHALCWHHPALWGLLPDQTDPLPTVPTWPEFLRGCLRYRQSLDDQLPDALRSDVPYRP